MRVDMWLFVELAVWERMDSLYTIIYSSIHFPENDITFLLMAKGNPCLCISTAFSYPSFVLAHLG